LRKIKENRDIGRVWGVRDLDFGVRVEDQRFKYNVKVKGERKGSFLQAMVTFSICMYSIYKLEVPENWPFRIVLSYAL